MSKPVVTVERAELQIIEIGSWWRAHRDKAPEKFEQELERAFDLLSNMPGAGTRYPHPRADVRRLLLPVTRNHVYYVERDDVVVVVAVWGAVKRDGPDLSSV